MRYNEFAITLAERAAQPTAGKVDIQPQPVTKGQVEQILRKNGYEDFKINGNKINVLVQIPAGQKKNEFRTAILNEIKKEMRIRYICSLSQCPETRT